MDPELPVWAAEALHHAVGVEHGLAFILAVFIAPVVPFTIGVVDDEGAASVVGRVIEAADNHDVATAGKVAVHDAGVTAG